MPSISHFYGIVIKMYFFDRDRHKTPHFHAFYGGYEAVFALDGSLISGSMPGKQAALIKAWAIIHENELADAWNLAVNGKEVDEIEPLR